MGALIEMVAQGQHSLQQCGEVLATLDLPA